MPRRLHPLLVVGALLVYLFLLGPLVVVFGAAFSTTTFLTFPPPGLSLRWFVNALTNSDFQNSFAVSMQVSLGGTFVSLLLGVPAAYALSRHQVQLPKSMSLYFVLPILVPEIVTGFSLLSFVSVDLKFSILLSLLVGHALLVLPYCVRVVSASLASFDFYVEEAAVSLGSPRLRTFFTIVLPNIRSGVMAAFALAFITSLNDVAVSVFLTGPGVSTLPIEILSYVQEYFDPTVAAVSVLLMFLTVAVMAIVERTLGLSSMAK